MKNQPNEHKKTTGAGGGFQVGNRLEQLHAIVARMGRSIDTHAQQARLLEASLIPGGVTSIECREVLNILCVNRRLNELEAMGAEFARPRGEAFDAHGGAHPNVASYICLRTPEEAAAMAGQGGAI